MARLTSKSNLARLAGVSRAAVTLAAQGALADAVVNGKIDTEHPIVVEWLARKVTLLTTKDGKITNRGLTQPIKRQLTTATTVGSGGASLKNNNNDLSFEVGELENLTIKQVVMRYGSVDGFKRFVESLKAIADYNFRDLKIKTQRGELIRRDLVESVLLPLVDVAYQRLVSDIPAAIVQQVISRLESGGSEAVLDCEKIIREAISKVLKSTKETIIQTEVLKKWKSNT